MMKYLEILKYFFEFDRKSIYEFSEIFVLEGRYGLISLDKHGVLLKMNDIGTIAMEIYRFGVVL